MKFQYKALCCLLVVCSHQLIFAQELKLEIFNASSTSNLSEKFWSSVVLRISASDEQMLRDLTALEASNDSTFIKITNYWQWSGFHHLPPFWDSISPTAAVYRVLHLTYLLSQASKHTGPDFDTLHFYNNFTAQDSIWIADGTRVYVRMLGGGKVSNTISISVAGITEEEKFLYLRGHKRPLPPLNTLPFDYSDWSFLKLERLYQIEDQIKQLEISKENAAQFSSLYQDIRNIKASSKDNHVIFEANLILCGAEHVFQRIESQQ